MNLLERIDRRLNDTRYRLQQLDFEDCATSLVGFEYPGLAPVTGGTDHGLDAELVKPKGQVLGLIVTSSRTWEGAKRSLRGSLKSARDHRRPVHQVMVANLAEINRQKRGKLAAIATEFGCELIQVYDRAWFANAFIANPEWRQKILQIPGGAFSLSRAPRGARPDEHQLPTVGREELLELADEAESDLVFWGVPGVGKSHVAGRLSGALFLAHGTSPERLLDDLLSTTPGLVVVDDAGSRAGDLEQLLHARQAENLGFRVAATCWPHEKEAVGDHLPGALTLEVDLLTREEVGSLLRERGITRLSVIVNLLEQARGRPAWALNLADLLVGQGDWRSVWTGQALRDQIRAFLRRSNAPSEAIHLLAAIALVGETTEEQARTIANLFQFTPVQFDELIRSVSIAGLVDHQRLRVWGAGTGGSSFEDSYRVVPRTIAASIVADIYFDGHTPPVRIRDLKAALPDRVAAILQTQIHAALLGATEPTIPSPAEMLEVLPATSGTDAGDELLRSYALVGPECARFVVEYLQSAVEEAAQNGDEPSAISATTSLASRVAETLASQHSAPSSALFDALALLASRDWDYKPPVKSLIEDVRDARSGERPDATAILNLAKALGSEDADVLPNQVWLDLASSVLKPTFDGNYMNPEKANEFVLVSFTWQADENDALFDALRVPLASRIADAAATGLEQLIDLVDKWTGLANGYSLPLGGRPAPAQEESGRRIALSLATEIATRIETPGLRARLNKAAASVGFTLSEPDALFAALTEDRDHSEDWEASRRRRDADLDAALSTYLQQPPEILMEWLARHEGDLATVRNGTASWQVMQRIAVGPDPERWLKTALDHGLGRSASPLIAKCVDVGLMARPMATKLLRDTGGRGAFVSAVISDCNDEELVSLVVSDLQLEDIESLDSSYAMFNASEATREALFTHPDPLVRGNAAALWAAEIAISADGIPDDPNWTSAMADFTVPSMTVSDYMQSKALGVFATAAPAAFMDLLVKHVERLEGTDDFDEWEESVSKLSGDDRNELWRRVRDSLMARNLFWVIASGDAEWITAAVSDAVFPIPVSRLLHASRFQHGKRFPLQTLAVMLRPLNWQPDDLLWTLEVGTHWGEEHELLARNLETCKELSESAEPDLARLGARGVEIYQPRLTEARAAARRAAVRGTLS